MFKIKVPRSLPIKGGLQGEQQRAEALEQQVKMLATTASAAVDKASELEEQLKQLKIKEANFRTHMKSQESMNSLFSAGSHETELTSDEEENTDQKEQEEHKDIRIIRDNIERSNREPVHQPDLELKYQILENTLNTVMAREKAREERVHQLEVALKAIHRARVELNSSRQWRYI